jgi:hypothetical protein
MGASVEFQKWARSMAARLRGEKTIEERVEEAMAPQNLLIEKQTEKGWEVE